MDRLMLREVARKGGLSCQVTLAPLSHPGPLELWVLVHCDQPLPSVRNPGPEKHWGLTVAYPPFSLTLDLLPLNRRFRWTEDRRVEG